MISNANIRIQESAESCWNCCPRHSRRFRALSKHFEPHFVCALRALTPKFRCMPTGHDSLPDSIAWWLDGGCSPFTWSHASDAEEEYGNKARWVLIRRRVFRRWRRFVWKQRRTRCLAFLKAHRLLPVQLCGVEIDVVAFVVAKSRAAMTLG